MKSADVSGMPKELEEVRRIALGEVPADEAQVRAALAQAWAWLAPLTSALLSAEPSSGSAKYTTEDVGRWFRAVVARIEGSTETMMVRMLRDAALEGAKVPGLVADNAALLDALKELADLMDGVLDGSYTPDSFTLQVAHRVLAEEHPGAPLITEHTIEVSALQARVAELERERDNFRAGERIARDRAAQALNLRDIAESERDALRAQVQGLKAMLPAGLDLYWSKRDGAPVITAHGKHEHQAFEAVAAVVAAVAALSTPPATRPDPRAELLWRAAWDARAALHQGRSSGAIALLTTAINATTDVTPPEEHAAPGNTSAKHRMMSSLDVRPSVPPLLPLSERIQHSLAKVGHEPTPLTTSAADALHPSGCCTCAGEDSCEWCRARCNVCGSPFIPEAVRHALAQVWSALHVTTAHQGVAVAVLRAVYPELPVPNARAGADILPAWNALAQAVTEAARLGAEDMRNQAARHIAGLVLAGQDPFSFAREFDALPLLPGEEVPRG
ncbi:hypothetical protein D7Y27_33180 [Corallococcus sp. AB004]|nr:hypothetical protein D7Y27_33180 [Corallococcus sp. AB004]